MIFEQYYLDCLSHASYLVGDESSGRAVVVDPQRDVAIYLRDAEEHGLTVDLAGFEVAMEWKGGKLTHATIRSLLGNPAIVRIGGKTEELNLKAGETYTFGK